MKFCANKNCQQKNPQKLENFNKRKDSKKDGLSSWCKFCSHKNNALWAIKNPEKKILIAARHRAKKEKIPFNITIEDIVIPKICPYLGIPILKNRKKITDNSPSLDRIVSKSGYIKGNVEIISNRANTGKSNLSAKEHLQIGKRMFKLTSNKMRKG